ncbi:MAG: hypothetical protein HUJ42_00035 [Malacoplasma sp.]|nr:hypothetical protein [Malacoplasma sp.]
MATKNTKKIILKKYNKEFNMTYAQLVSHLLDKYGPAKYDYFFNSTFKSKNQKISRSAEGLQCHHIDEDKAIMLSTREFAMNNPFEYQKAERLIYCNIMEHLLLHVKIMEEPRHPQANKNEVPGIGGAVEFIIRNINDYYDGYQYKRQYWVRIMSHIKNDFDDYIKILNYLWTVIENNPIYSEMYTKKIVLSLGFYWNIVQKVFKALKIKR